MGLDIPILFMAGDLNSIVFKSEKSVGMEEITLYFAMGTRLFDHFQRGQILEYSFFNWGRYFGQFFQWVCEKGVFLSFESCIASL